jgi:hypothetical protein
MADYENPTDPSWRELARRIQEESDPERLIELIRELIAKFDDERIRKGLPPSAGPLGFASRLVGRSLRGFFFHDTPQLLDKLPEFFPIGLIQHALDKGASR